jgi:hypothetical protein
LNRTRNNLLGLMLTLIEEYIWATAEERLAIALWILHTYTFRRFRHTPRLLVISPIEDCGKTTVLKVIEWGTQPGHAMPEGRMAPAEPGAPTRGDRNNNPGNIKKGDDAERYGAIGYDSGGHAIFPTWEQGNAAHQSLLRRLYGNRTIEQMGKLVLRRSIPRLRPPL